MAHNIFKIYTSLLFMMIAYAFVMDTIAPLSDTNYCDSLYENATELPAEKENKGESSSKDDLKKKLEDTKFYSTNDILFFLSSDLNIGADEQADLFHSHYQEVLSPPPDFCV
ncbi:hypothetical protein K4L44_03160 [Halosquirtibacter laminarini]|uniref:Uncharacterized protein n=1 Tax=Halosquirtibacter laminarini TaxID=3374600 RepID=A0AC61NR65_9BACT|nr:hypothetical protein K4L44_03160 [Prolixibacteraceae bacterium]